MIIHAYITISLNAKLNTNPSQIYWRKTNLQFYDSFKYRQLLSDAEWQANELFLIKTMCVFNWTLNDFFFADDKCSPEQNVNVQKQQKNPTHNKIFNWHNQNGFTSWLYLMSIWNTSFMYICILARYCRLKKSMHFHGI